MKNRLGRIVDFIFSRLMIFIIAFIWVRYYYSELYAALPISLFITVVLSFLLYLKKERKAVKTELKASQERHMNKIMTQFLLQERAKTLMFFKEFFINKLNAKLINGYLTIVKENADKDNINIIILPLVFEAMISERVIVYALNVGRKNNAQRVVILCQDCEPKAFELSSQIGAVRLEILKNADIYLLLKKYDSFPEINLELTKPKGQSFKQLLEYALNRKKTRGYFFTALILVFGGLITGFTLYYLIVSSLVMLLALFSFISPYNKKLKAESFEF
jgi:hypothetical protein